MNWRQMLSLILESVLADLFVLKTTIREVPNKNESIICDKLDDLMCNFIVLINR